MKELADPKLAGLLREYAEELRAASPPADLEARLMAAVEPRPAARPRRLAMGWVIGAVAAAAAVAGVFWLPAPKKTAEPVQTARTVAPVPKPPVVLEVSKPVRVASAKPRPILRNSPRVAREMVSEFVPLAENEYLPAPRQAQVYRVSVPRATLASLGFPVQEEGNTDSRLTADVLMDQDGLARAVRLVKTVY